MEGYFALQVMDRKKLVGYVQETVDDFVGEFGADDVGIGPCLLKVGDKNTFGRYLTDDLQDLGGEGAKVQLRVITKASNKKCVVVEVVAVDDIHVSDMEPNFVTIAVTRDKRQDKGGFFSLQTGERCLESEGNVVTDDSLVIEAEVVWCEPGRQPITSWKQFNK